MALISLANSGLILVQVILLGASLLVAGGEIRRTYMSPYETINKVSLTQKGYLQFLKYVADVPTLSEFTCCIWMRSDNLNYSHPLLSYSMNERDRLIRVWVSDAGMYVNMAIFEEAVFRIPINVRANHWNHYCPSWNSFSAMWTFHYNGKLMQSGLNYKLRDIRIPGGGDVVVGQEYTDFSKGLDDGIEGDIYAFNFVASSTAVPKPIYYPPKAATYRRQMYIPPFNEPPANVVKPLPSSLSSSAHHNGDTAVLGYFTTSTRTPKGLIDIGKTMLNKLYSLFDFRSRIPLALLGNAGGQIRRTYKSGNALDAGSEHIASEDKTLGMFLVELSYENCAQGRGAPLVDDKVIVSWTRSPVKVFGGATLKTVTPFCHRI